MTGEKTPILVVEDETEIRELITLLLTRQGAVVKEFSSVEAAMPSLAQTRYGLAVLDWMLPGLSGYEFVKILRAKDPAMPILMVTAKGTPQDVVAGLEQGADDYITKPFDVAVLMARVRSLLRRSQMDRLPVQDPEQIELAGLKIDLKQHQISIQGKSIHLTPSEFKLITIMVENQGRVLTRERMIELIQGEGINVVGRTIDTHVFGLRKKLGEWSDNVETIRGVGYRVKADL